MFSGFVSVFVGTSSVTMCSGRYIKNDAIFDANAKRPQPTSWELDIHVHVTPIRNSVIKEGIENIRTSLLIDVVENKKMHQLETRNRRVVFHLAVTNADKDIPTLPLATRVRIFNSGFCLLSGLRVGCCRRKAFVTFQMRHGQNDGAVLVGFLYLFSSSKRFFFFYIF